MAPYQELNSACQRQKYIKKGRIHSHRALQKRTKEWIEKWSPILALADRVFEEMSVDEHCNSKSPESLRGFEFQSITEAITVYYMTRDVIDDLEMEENLTTDEEGEDDDEERSVSAIHLSLRYPDNSETANASGTLAFVDIKGDHSSKTSVPDEIGNCLTEASTLSSDKNVINDASLELPHSENSSNEDNHDLDDNDPEIERTRPISRISLVIPPYDNVIVDDENNSSSDETGRPSSRMSGSGYMSYFETDYEDDDINTEKFVSKKPKSIKGVYGKIAGINVGTVWKNRRQFSRRSVHRPQNATIHGGPKGAYSMVLSANSTVNDRGEEFDFYGEGGRDQKTKKHVRDQRMTRGNLSLRENMQAGTPVRVIRGYQLQNMYAPEIGYRYDGLYEVTQLTMDKKIDGYKIFMFTFARRANQPPPPWHTFNINMPLPSPSSDHQSNSDDDISIETEELKRPYRKKRMRLGILESRCSTPLSCMSDDIAPELQLPENIVEYPIVYPIPPQLSPSLSFSNGSLGIRRPAICLEKLDDDIAAEIFLKPINVNDPRLLNSTQQCQKKIDPNSVDEMKLMKKKRKYVYTNKILAVNCNILKKRIKNVRNCVVTGKKIKNVKSFKNTGKKIANIKGLRSKKIFNKKLKLAVKKSNQVIKNQDRQKMVHVNNKNPHNSEAIIKKKRGRPKIARINESNLNSDMKIRKKRGRPKGTVKKTININKSVHKVGIKKDIQTQASVKGRKKESAINNIKSTNSKKHDVGITQRKTSAGRPNEKKQKKSIKKYRHAQGDKSELTHSYPGKKRGRKSKNDK